MGLFIGNDFIVQSFSAGHYFFAELLGVESPVNILYLIMIFLALWKIFSLSLRNSRLEYQIGILAREFAILNKQESDKDEKEQDAGRAADEGADHHTGV